MSSCLPARIDHKPDRSATGHSPTRDIVDPDVPEQKLRRPEVPSSAINQGHLGPAHGMRCELAWIQADTTTSFLMLFNNARTSRRREMDWAL
jgi:hypothetical protein